MRIGTWERCLTAVLAVFGLTGTATFVGVPSAGAAPTTRFVNASSGSDSNPCTQARPCKSIARGIAVASSGDTVSVAAGTYGAGSQSGVIDVNKNLTIAGAGARSTTIINTVQVDLGGNAVTLSGVTIDTGRFEQGVRNEIGTLTISSSVITNNGANNFNVVSSGIDNLDSVGGQQGTANLTVIDSTISNNGGGALGNSTGAIFMQPAVSVSALDNATVINSTISGNTANTDGAITVGSLDRLTARDTTISANTGATTGGIDTGSGAIATLTNTLLAGNTSGGAVDDGPDCVGTLTDGTGGHNLLGDNSNCAGLVNGVNGDQVGNDLSPIDPKLASLGNNGGPTDTMALQAGSPAIGGGDATDCQAAPVNNLDQRGDPRHADIRGTCDIGAYDTGPVPPLPYHPLPPARITDTRLNSGFPNAGKTLGPNTTLNVQVTGAGEVPASGVGAAVLNVTATNPTKQSFLTVWPTGATRPTVSNLNFSPGQTVPNLTEVGLGTGGQVSVFNPAGSVDVVVDVEGYTAAAGSGTGLYNPLNPTRITDTRPNSGFPNAGKTLGPNTALNVQVTGAGNVPPTGVSAVVLNVTATGPTKQSFLTVWPAGSTRPTASNLNFAPGQTVPNRVIVPVSSPGGQVSIFNPAGSVNVVVDVGGYFTDNSHPVAPGSEFTPATPTRITDTRPNSGFPNEGKTLRPNTTLPVQVAGAGPVPASGVTGAVMNVTVTNTTQQSFLTVWPSATTRPTASDLNWVANETVPNLVVVKLGTDGAVQVFNAAGNTDVVVDVSGWYS